MISEASLEANYRRATFSIAAASGMASLTTNFWYPFLPLYILELGARDEREGGSN